MDANVDIYGGLGANDVPLYTVADASRYLKSHPATLRAWFAGTNQGLFKPVLSPANTGPLRLSFNNLAEAYVLKNLRTEHNVKLSVIRAAIAAASIEAGIPRLLLSRDLKTFAGNILIKKFDEYLTLGASGQLAMSMLLQGVIERFVWEDPSFPAMLFPFVHPNVAKNVISINPRRSFGAPTIASRGVTTAIVRSRYNIGETVEELAEDYGVTNAEITAAILYEEAA